MRRVAFVLAVVAAVGLVPAAAHAQQVRFDVGATIGGAWMPSAPAVNISPDPASAIRFPTGTTSRLAIPLGFVGIGAYATFRLSRQLYLPTLGVTYWGAVGPSPRVTTSVDGTIVELRPYRSSILDVSLIGIGLQAPLKRWLVTADVTAGFSIFFLPGSVAAGNVTEDTNASALSPTLRVNLTGCRRFDPWTRLCAVLSPNVYSFGFFNGGSFTLRWEIGS